MREQVVRHHHAGAAEWLGKASLYPRGGLLEDAQSFVGG